MTYPGGKNAAGIVQRIINLMPPHDVYVEAFLGSGAVLRAKRPARVNIGIDRDRQAIELCRSLMPPSLMPPGTIAGSDIAAIDDASVRLIVKDYLDHQEALLNPKALIYCDPPYPHSTRSRKDIYRYEMSEADHALLLGLITRATSEGGAMVMISGYRCPLYERALDDWQQIDYMAQTRGGPKHETLWMNFDPPGRLHDYSFLGDDYRERERISRKVKRWTAKLQGLPPLEQQAILNQLKSHVEPQAKRKI